MLKTHCASASEAPNSRRRVGKATFTTVASRMIMKMPNITEIRIFHFLSSPPDWLPTSDSLIYHNAFPSVIVSQSYRSSLDNRDLRSADLLLTVNVVCKIDPLSRLHQDKQASGVFVIKIPRPKIRPPNSRKSYFLQSKLDSPLM